MISSMVAPSFSAPWICRRVPGAYIWVINYRVDSLDGMLAQLKANGIEPVKGPESAENGKFAWILDPDGNKVELWEPMLWDDKNKQ